MVGTKRKPHLKLYRTEVPSLIPAANLACDWLETLTIPEGPHAGKRLKLAPFQRDFVMGGLHPDTRVAVLSVGRGNAKSALAAGVALGALVGQWDAQPRRDIILAARTRDQARMVWQYAAGFIEYLPTELRERLFLRRSPRLEIEYEGDGGGHVMRAIAADAKSALGTSPTLAILDERAYWPRDGRGDELEASLLTGLGKRGGKAWIISTSASDDAHAFSKWVDAPPEGTFVREYRAAPGLPADDLESLKSANPGADFGIGATTDWLLGSARQAIQRGGSALASFRLFHRNERVSAEARDVLIALDQWLAAEVKVLPPRSGQVIVGIDLGGSMSMSGSAFYWPDTGRLEVYGCFPSVPDLVNRGLADGVGQRYDLMRSRGELYTLGLRTVPIDAWLVQEITRIQGQPIAAIVADRFKQSEITEGLQRAGIMAPVIWRGMGFRDGNEDIERFRRAVFDGNVKTTESLLMRSAIGDTVVIRDPANNCKFTKARSAGRIDAVAASVLAVAEGSRFKARPAPKVARFIWA